MLSRGLSPPLLPCKAMRKAERLAVCGYPMERGDGMMIVIAGMFDAGSYWLPVHGSHRSILTLCRNKRSRNQRRDRGHGV